MPSTKYQNTEYNRFQRVSGHINSLFSECECFHLTFDEWLDRRDKILRSDDYRRMPAWYKGKVAGISEVLFNQLYDCLWGNLPPLMVVSTGPDGRMFAEMDYSWLKEDHEYSDNMKCHYIWRRPYVDKGEVKYWG